MLRLGPGGVWEDAGRGSRASLQEGRLREGRGGMRGRDSRGSLTTASLGMVRLLPSFVSIIIFEDLFQI